MRDGHILVEGTYMEGGYGHRSRVPVKYVECVSTILASEYISHVAADSAFGELSSQWTGQERESDK